MNAYTQKDYEAIEAAVLESPRGRWFLGEFTRRNRAADTLMLLDAIRKLQRVGGISSAVGEDLAAELHGLSETIASTMDRGAGEDGLRNALEQLSKVKRRIDGMLAERAEGAELTAENLKFFEGDEDLFTSAPASPSLSLVGENQERTIPARKPAAEASDSKEHPSDRIVFIRRASSKETSIPLADEPDETLPAGHSQPGS